MGEKSVYESIMTGLTEALEDASFFHSKELIPGDLDGSTGDDQTPQGCYVRDDDLEEFDKAFPPKKS